MGRVIPVSASTIEVVCQACGACFFKRLAEWRRAPIKRFFCTKECFHETRRAARTDAEKKAMKAEYDRAYRAQHLEILREKKRRWHEKNYDPEKARLFREKNREAIIAYRKAYMTTPEYRARKAAYDADLRAYDYGHYHEAYKLLLQLEKALRSKWTSSYERAKALGRYDGNRKKDRKRSKQHVESN